MKILKISGGIIFTALGLLWSLQGGDLIHIKPILCVANCEEIAGGSMLWLSIGIISTVIGLGLFASLKFKPKI